MSQNSVLGKCYWSYRGYWTVPAPTPSWPTLRVPYPKFLCTDHLPSVMLGGLEWEYLGSQPDDLCDMCSERPF